MSAIYNSDNCVGEANKLFLKNIYDATGYYEYNCFNNFAEYDRNTKEFTVYEEMGIPKNGKGGSLSSFARGNFLPYNHIDVNKPATNTRLYDSLYGWVSLENPVFGGQMYLMKESKVDYYFGTVIEANFLQAKDGLDENNAPIVYEFMGDDDLWVYIDNVLVLDLGGIHSTITGSINFKTGEVDAGGREFTTIRDCFKAAGIFPDGSEWNDELVDEYFEGNTFADYSGHSFKMFYQERGASASTLKVRFNLPVVHRGSFTVEKQLDGTSQSDYANVQFAYQAFVKINGEDVALRPGMIFAADGRLVDPEHATEEQRQNAVRVVYENTSDEVTFYDNQQIGENSYSDVFYLKHNQAVTFKGIPETLPYFVQEINVSGAYFKTVMINEVNLFGEEGIAEDSNVTAVSTAKTVLQRQRLKFVNSCSSANLKNLRITKHVENPVDDGATFKFRVYLENTAGQLVEYAFGQYYIVKADASTNEENYYSFVNGVLTNVGTTPPTKTLKAGPHGTIADIPDGYTIVIKDLLADTDFKVIEEIQDTKGYSMTSKVLTEGTCNPPQLEGADGRIKLRTDAEVIVTNHRCSTLTANKVWASGEDVSRHGQITLALYQVSGDELTLAQKGDVLKSEPVQTVTWPGTSAVWNLDLPANADLSGYVVREVKVEGTGSAQTLTPVESGARILVRGETTVGIGEDLYYTVSYAPGTEQTYPNSAIHEREDTVTTTLQRYAWRKVDASTQNNLSGAVFNLYLVQNGSRVSTPAIENLTSGTDGMLALEDQTRFVLAAGDYELEETDAPSGYNMLTEAVAFSIGESGVTCEGKTVSYDEDTGVFSITIPNIPGVVLPNTGGTGTVPFTALGGLLIAGACALLLLWRRRNA